MFNTEHAMLNMNNIHKLYSNLNIFTRVRARTNIREDRQTERQKTQFINAFQPCWNMLKNIANCF